MKERELVHIHISLERCIMHQAPDSEMRKKQSIDFLSHQIGCFASQNNARASQMSLEFIQSGFYFPSLMVQGSQLCGGSLGWIQNRSNQSIERLRILNIFKGVIDYPDFDSRSISPTMTLRRVNFAQIRPIRQTPITWQNQTCPDSPKQSYPRLGGIYPTFMGKKISVRQAQHTIPEMAEDKVRQRSFSGSTSCHLRTKQYMGSIFHQRHQSDLRKGTLTTTHGRSPKFFRVVLGISHVEGSAVYCHKLPATVPSPSRLRLGYRCYNLIVKPSQRVFSQPGSGLRDAGLSSDFDRLPRPEQPPDTLQKTSEHLLVGRLHVKGQCYYIIYNDMRGKIPLTLTGSFGLLQNLVHRGQREFGRYYTEADVVRNTSALWQLREHTSHCAPPPFG
jgi:hypothetical protein